MNKFRKVQIGNCQPRKALEMKPLKNNEDEDDHMPSFGNGNRDCQPELRNKNRRKWETAKHAATWTLQPKRQICTLMSIIMERSLRLSKSSLRGKSRGIARKDSKQQKALVTIMIITIKSQTDNLTTPYSVNRKEMAKRVNTFQS